MDKTEVVTREAEHTYGNGSRNFRNPENPNSFAVIRKTGPSWCNRQMNELLTAQSILQTGSTAIVSMSIASAMLYIGLFGALTLVTMALKSALAGLGWGLSGFTLVLVLLDILPAEVYFLFLGLTMLSVASVAAWIVKNP